MSNEQMETETAVWAQMAMAMAQTAQPVLNKPNPNKKRKHWFLVRARGGEEEGAINHSKG
jgi:hypothetical protein